MVKAKSNKQKQKQGNTHIQKKQKQDQIKQKAREQPDKQKNPKWNQTIKIKTIQNTKPKNKTKAVCPLKNKAQKQNKLIKMIKILKKGRNTEQHKGKVETEV